MPIRTILKDRDTKPLIEELNKIPGFEHLSRKSRVETEMVKSSEVIFVDGQPVAFRREGHFVPVLTNMAALEKMPRITVDMGAVPHVRSMGNSCRWEDHCLPQNLSLLQRRGR